MRSDFVEKDILGHILFALTEENRLACRVSLETGLRIDDALSLPSKVLNQNSFTVCESKTGKNKRCRLSAALRRDLRHVAGEKYIFPHRIDPERHRTRQAVYSDIKRAARLFRVKKNVTPHSMRKAYAVDLMRRYGDISKVAEALNHDKNFMQTTMLYALADIISSGFERKK
jgi:integrase